MKILWLTEFYPRKNKTEIIGGVQSRCYYVSKYLSQKHRLTVLEGIPKKFAKVSYLSIFLRLVYLPFEIIKALTLDFDLIEASNTSMFFPATIIGKLKRKPVIFWYPDTFIGSWQKIFGPVGLAGEMMERAALFLGASHYIAISQTVKNKLIAHGVPESKISVIYCGVDLEEIEKIRQQVKIKSTDLIVVSRLEKYKNVDKVIEAVSPSMSLKIIGWGRMEKELKTRVNELNLNNIEFLGKIDSHDDVLKQIVTSKVLCHPSTVEGFGIVLIESMALGVPVLAANIAVINEITHGFKGSLTFSAANIKKLLTDQKLYEQKKKEALSLSKIYDYKKIARETEQLYEIIIQS